MNKKTKLFLLLVLVIIVVLTGGFLLKNNNRQSITTILSKPSYAYLPKKAKEYIEKVYEETGEVVLTEKNKEDNKPYLNPEYIEYLELSEGEKQDIDLIPDAYILDYATNTSYSDYTLPSYYDLRNESYISALKNQGSTGICWAFASIENVETLIMKESGEPYSDQTQKFSVRQMDYATSTDGFKNSYVNWENSDNGSRKVGDGGNFLTSSIIMANGLTLVDESVLPWNEENNKYWPKDIFGYEKSLYEVNSTIQMPTINSDSASEELINSFVIDVKNYIIEYGGPFVGTYSPQSTCGFKNVDGRIVVKTDDCVNDNLTKNEGHAMQIIGWDDNYSYTYCDAGTKHYAVNNGACSSGSLTHGKGAWILRNSWGDNTDYGYVYLTYNSTRLSIGFTTSISEMSNRTWDNNYHSNPWVDGSISNGMLGVTSQTKEFNTNNTKPEKIEKIKLLTASKNGKFKLSIVSGNNEYNDVATIDSNEAGVYTIELSDQNIILDNGLFDVTVESINDGFFFKDSISVFTSNIDDTSYAITYSSDAYDSTRPLSYDNPLYLYSSKISNDYYAYNAIISSYLKNLPKYSDMSYRLVKDDFVAYSFGEVQAYYKGDVASARLSDNTNKSSYYFNLKDELGETWIMEVVYNDEVVDSFPVKFYSANKKTKSNIRLYANKGTDYYRDYSLNDLTTDNFENLNKDNNFYNNGFYIESWNTKADGTGISYETDSVPVYCDMELYAQWSTEKLKVTITYEDDYSNQTMPSQTYALNEKIVFPINQFVRDGYAFESWSLYAYINGASTFHQYNEQETSIDSVSNYIPLYPVFNITLRAKPIWISDYVTLSFDSNGGTGIMTPMNRAPGAYGSIKKNQFVRENYTFDGWNTKPDGSGDKYTGNWQFNDNATLYAQWKLVDHIVTFNANGGTGMMSNQQSEHNESVVLNKNTFVRAGYTFTGWNTEPDGTGDDYLDEQNFALTSDLTLYAMWEINSYTVTFNANGGEGQMDNQQISYNTPTALSKNVFIKFGYTFARWNTKADGSGTSYSDEQVVSITDNLNLYAQWEEEFDYIINNYQYDEENNYIINIPINTEINTFTSYFTLNYGYGIDVDYKTIDNKQLLYTGSKVRITKGLNVYKEITNVIAGDTNGDGKINYLDYVNVYNHIQKVKHPELNKKLLVDEYLLAADMSGDNKINYLDYVRIYNKIKELKGGTN